MRKISKSRVDDDVVSSTNGSLLNDDRAGSPNNDVNEKDAGSDNDTHANTEENDGSGAENNSDEPKKKGRGRKRKAGKENSEKLDDADDDADPHSDANDDDDDSDGDYGSKKKQKTPKKATPKNKAKKRKTGKEKAVEEEYEVEKVVDSKKIKGKLHYLIRWKGYSADSDTWEPHNTLSCPDLISKYNTEKENAKAKSKEDKKPKGKSGTNKRKGKKDAVSTPSKKTKTEWDSEAADENAEYEVERILEVHHKKNGKREFLIHWKGWSNKFDSWEPEENLNCSELINKFMSKVSAAKTSDSRNLRVAPETTNRFTLQVPSTGRRLSKRRGQRQRVRYDNAE